MMFKLCLHEFVFLQSRPALNSPKQVLRVSFSGHREPKNSAGRILIGRGHMTIPVDQETTQPVHPLALKLDALIV